MAGVSLTLAAFAMVVMLPLGNAARTDLGSTPIDVVPGTGGHRPHAGSAGSLHGGGDSSVDGGGHLAGIREP